MAADFRFRQKEMTGMKTTLVALMICAFAQGVHAKEPVCRDIAAPGARLACYDLASPPRPEPRALTESDASRPPYSDPFVAEEARTAAKLKNICRGC